MIRAAARLVALTVLWLILWRDVSLANVLTGLLVAMAVTVLYPSAPAARPRRHNLRIVPLVVFLVYFARLLLLSSVAVARVILSPSDRIHTGILEIPLRGCSDLETTVISDAITLTPGTMTVDVADDPRRIYVHVLHYNEVEEVRQDIHQLVHRIVQAIGTEEAQAELEKVRRQQAEDGGAGPGGGSSSREETRKP